MKRPYAKPAIQSASKCLVDGCDRPEELVRGRPAGGLCCGHRYRKQRGLPLEAPLQDLYARRMSRTELLFEAFRRWAFAESDEDERRFRETAMRRVRRYSASGGRAPSKR